jgi:hypothetical protein
MFGFAYFKIQSFRSHYFQLDNLKLKHVKIQQKPNWSYLMVVQQKLKKIYEI